MMTDPISDMLARIRNAGQARHKETSIPSSRLKLAVARALAEAGFLGEVRVEARDGKPLIVVAIRYDRDGDPLIDGLRRVSRPGRRVYVGASEIPRVRNGLGMAVLSTSKGVLSDKAAREASLGGELLCEVW
jgi:small subunit ribosomal protein S8